MTERCDVLIVGAGPAGLATAIGIAERGGSVLVLDRRSPPLDKACGEGVMPAGVDLLGALGVDVPHDGCAPFRGIRFVHGDTHVEGAFAAGHGLGIRRTVLAGAMAARARRLGVRFAYGRSFLGWREGKTGGRATTTAGDVDAAWLVGADGLHSTVRQRAGLATGSPGRRRYGMRRHYRVRPWSACVEVHWSDVAEAYVTPIGRDEVGIALLSNGGGERFDVLLSTFPALCRRLASASASSAVRGAGPLRQEVRRRHAGRLALVGDAAGYLDPITGEGITLGLRSARALVETLAAGEPLSAYERRYRRSSRDFYLLTGALLAATRMAPLRRRLVPSLAEHAELFERLVQINAGQRPIRSIGLAGVWHLVAGLATGGA
jgi:flavin-dependent dehydrogenase